MRKGFTITGLGVVWRRSEIGLGRRLEGEKGKTGGRKKTKGIREKDRIRRYKSVLARSLGGGRRKEGYEIQV